MNEAAQDERPKAGDYLCMRCGTIYNHPPHGCVFAAKPFVGGIWSDNKSPACPKFTGHGADCKQCGKPRRGHVKRYIARLEGEIARLYDRR